MRKISERADALLSDLAEHNPTPAEKIFARHWFDPMHGLTELRYAAKRRLIALVETGSTPERFRFHLTPDGRIAAAAFATEAERADLSATQSKLRELLSDLAFENPAPSEAWIDAGNFDPLHGVSEINYAHRLSWIEADGDVSAPNALRLRLTALGRSRLAKAPRKAAA